jgi:ABC-type sugar transport system ATPase subunit
MSDIRLEGVSKRYGAVAAADEVDLAVAQGEFDLRAAVTLVLGRAGKLRQRIV